MVRVDHYVHLLFDDPRIGELLTLVRAISAKVDIDTTLIQKDEKMQQELIDDFNTLTSDVAAQKTVIQSAVTMIAGINQQLADAIAASAAANATPEQLQGFKDLQSALEQNTATLANSIPAGTGTPPAAAGTPAPTA